MVARAKQLPKASARMRQPITRAEVHALMREQASIILSGMNELEARIQALESAAGIVPENRTAGGLVLPSGMERST